MARTGDNIYLRNTGKWEGRYIRGREADGRIKYGYVSGSTYEETLTKRDKAANAYMERTNNRFSSEGKLLFSVISHDWLEKRKSCLKESSIAKYRNILNWYLLPQFGSRDITEITKEEFSGYMTWLLTSGGIHGRGLSPQMVRNIISVLKSILEYAYDCKNIQVISLGKFPLKNQKKPLRVFSVNEQHKLEQYLLSDINGSRLGILLCLYTGIRLGELCALKWEDISFDNRKLDIHATMSRVQISDDSLRKTKVIVTPPKSLCSMREIPIPSDIIPLLEKKKAPENTYFLTGCQKIYMEPRTMENHFKAITAACGIADANFHALRHTFATRCIEKGFDLKSLSEILGHASVKITLDRYVHPTMELKQRNMDKLSVYRCAEL